MPAAAAKAGSAGPPGWVGSRPAPWAAATSPVRASLTASSALSPSFWASSRSFSASSSRRRAIRSRSWAASRSRRASASSAAAASTAAAAAVSPNAKSTTELKTRDCAAWAAMIRALAVP